MSKLDSLARVELLAAIMTRQQRRVALMEAQLTEAKSFLRALETEDLPELMREFGLLAVDLVTGERIEIKDEVETSITEERRPSAHAWLRENKFGGLIKCVVGFVLPAGEEKVAEEIAEAIADQFGKEAEISERVHPQTLKSFVKEQMALQKPPPFELFGVFPYSKAKLILPKAGKGRR